MKQFAVVDCETDPFLFGREPQPFIWGFYDGISFKTFGNGQELVSFLRELDIVVYAHNGGKFDWHFISDFIEPDSEILIINGRLSKFKIGKCEFRDSYNLLPVPLASYQKTEIDYNKFESDVRQQHMEEITDYLKDDCRDLYTVVQTFIDNHGMPITLASAALKFWKNNYYTGEMFNSSQSFYNRFKDYYYGGRVECFTMGVIQEVVKIYDINSAYPFAMSDFHPWGFGYSVMDDLPDSNLERCFIDCDAISKGTFPQRAKDGSLVFPNSSEVLNFKITGWEYLAAIETGTAEIISINSVIQFDDIITFGDYVDYWFEKKAELKNGDKAEYLIAKLFLNSLYGKFGSNPQKYKSYHTLEPQYVRACEELEQKTFAGMLGKNALMSKELDEDEQHFYNVATAASVTGFVRAYLWRAICKAEKVYYCDTDSIICRDFNIEISPELGKWNFEGVYNGGAIAGKKLYAFKNGTDEKIASKGVKLNYQQILAIAKGEEITYNKDSPTFGFKKKSQFITRKIKMRIK
jgi:hypothetical protein